MKLMTKRASAMGILSAAAMALVLAGCTGGGNSTGGTGGVLSGGGGGGAVVTVNGEPISRGEFTGYLEATNGETALRELIDNKLITQLAKKEKIDVTDADIDAVIKQRKGEGGAGAQMAEEVEKLGGVQKDAYRNSIRNQLMIDRLVTKDVKVDDEALQAWFTKNKATYSIPTRIKLGVLITASKPRADIMAQQLKAKTKTFAQLVEEQKKQKDPVATQSATETPQAMALDALPKDVKGPLSKLKAGDMTGVLLLTPPSAPQKVYGIFRLVTREEGTNPTLADVRAMVETDYKLEQVARKIVKQNPKNPPFDETVQRTESALMQQNFQRQIFQQPTRRETLRYINNTAVQQLTSQAVLGAKVTADDPAYTKLAEAYTPPAPAGAAPGAPGAPAPAAGAPAPEGAPAPAASAPATSAPATSAPATSAPATSAPAASATTAPAAPAAPAPAAPAPTPAR